MLPVAVPLLVPRVVIVAGADGEALLDSELDGEGLALLDDETELDGVGLALALGDNDGLVLLEGDRDGDGLLDGERLLDGDRDGLTDELGETARCC